MAKVSLRIYNRDIENLIDQGQLDEAIAHCRHILKSFPKHLETYRLLGKAYLEAKRYDEAVDVLQRVLMAVPDDFVSHVGMSIIRDDQGKLDDAIWHMERAFESQPSNAAIQGELRRLYGRRDGVEPPKIRMTRGALAHMYVQGELYPQAISEIKAVLGQDAQRVDMQVLLALAYYRSGQKADASQIASQLLNRAGGEFGFEANRIMVELLQGSDSAEDVAAYRSRVNELDPYASYVQGSVFQSGLVSDAAVTLERLEYSGQSVDSVSAWTPGGIGISTPAAQPEWLTNVEPADSEPAAVAPVENEIPEFLREAGWGESTGAFDESASPFGIEQTPPVGDEAMAPGEMPDWLQAMAPSTSIPATEAPVAPAEAEDMPDWLGGLAGGTISSTETPITPEDTPTWLRSFRDEAAPAEEPAASEPVEDSMPLDWASVQDEPAAPAEPAPPSTPAPMPAPQASLETLGASAQEQDDAVAWLESLAAKHGAKPEELVTDPEARSETPPDWVEQARAIAESQPPVPTPPQPTAQPEDIVEEDRTGIWLRDLAESESLAEAVQDTKAEDSTELLGGDEAPPWLQNLEETMPSRGGLLDEPTQTPEQPVSAEEPELLPAAADLPAWLQGLDSETESPAPEPVAPEPEPIFSEDTVPSWLRGDDETLPPPSVPPVTTSDWRPAQIQEEEEVEPEPEQESIELTPPVPRPAPPARPAPDLAETQRSIPRVPRPAEAELDMALESAQAELNRGDIPAALEHYSRLIKRGRLMEEIIRDLREALYRYPVEVTVWQTLGDAYMRANRLQEALDAYTKAEELLR